MTRIMKKFIKAELTTSLWQGPLKRKLETSKFFHGKDGLGDTLICSPLDIELVIIPKLHHITLQC